MVAAPVWPPSIPAGMEVGLTISHVFGEIVDCRVGFLRQLAVHVTAAGGADGQLDAAIAKFETAMIKWAFLNAHSFSNSHVFMKRPTCQYV